MAKKAKVDETIKVSQCMFKHDDGVEQSISVVEVLPKTYAVLCGACGALGPIDKTPSKALGKWNNRTVVVVSQEQYDEWSKNGRES